MQYSSAAALFQLSLRKSNLYKYRLQNRWSIVRFANSKHFANIIRLKLNCLRWTKTKHPRHSPYLRSYFSNYDSCLFFWKRTWKIGALIGHIQRDLVNHYPNQITENMLLIPFRFWNNIVCHQFCCKQWTKQHKVNKVNKTNNWKTETRKYEANKMLCTAKLTYAQDHGKFLPQSTKYLWYV